MCFSDLKVNVAGEKVNAHKFVLAARSDVWSLANMASTSELDLSGEQHPSDFTVSKKFLKLYPLVTYLGTARKHSCEGNKR